MECIIIQECNLLLMRMVLLFVIQMVQLTRMVIDFGMLAIVSIKIKLWMM